jgi:hypothetical protein
MSEVEPRRMPASEKREGRVELEMSDPRNVAHNKKVKQGKAHQENASESGAKPKKNKRAPKAAEAVATDDANKQAVAPEKAPIEQAPGEYEKAQVVLSKLKEMEFHSRANIEMLAQLTLTIEEELKQKEFSGPIGDVYAAQDGFHTRIAELIGRYEKKTETLRPAG